MNMVFCESFGEIHQRKWERSWGNRLGSVCDPPPARPTHHATLCPRMISGKHGSLVVWTPAYVTNGGHQERVKWWKKESQEVSSHYCNPSTREAGGGRLLQAHEQPWIHRKTPVSERDGRHERGSSELGASHCSTGMGSLELERPQL